MDSASQPSPIKPAPAEAAQGNDNLPEFESREKPVNAIKESFTEELVIALCGPIGSPISVTSDIIKEDLESRNYKVEVYKVSDTIRDYLSFLDLPIVNETDTVIERKTKLIEGGNVIRKEYHEAFLAMAIVSKIYKRREKEKDNTRYCYIIDSIKNYSEYELLKTLYQDIFYLVGICCSKTSRIKALTDRSGDRAGAEKIIKTDFKDSVETYGQNVKEIFPLSDVFIDKKDDSNNERIKDDINRFLNTIFHTSIVTPNTSERAMYEAYSASLNSACLSRAVGAAIASRDNRIIGNGWNDVPKYNGGVYSSDNKNEDNRCFNSGQYCRNDKEKDHICNGLEKDILESGAIDISIEDEELKGVNIDEKRKSRLKEVIQGKKSRIRDLTEFSKAVHAEMHALFNALLNDSASVKGGDLYVTTFPCHNCARHIILSGINNVYYISPYPKSLALDLHGDAISDVPSEKHVSFLPYSGIAPRRFTELFTRRDERKIAGKVNLPNKSIATHGGKVSTKSMPFHEARTTYIFSDIAKKITDEFLTIDAKKGQQSTEPTN